MAEYYLISQLPSLDGLSETANLPITQTAFMELCRRFLNRKTAAELEKLTLIPPRTPQRSSSALVERWNEGESRLRLALAKLRAEKMNKPFAAEEQTVAPGILQAARAAVEIESPLDAEKFLSRYRLAFLETLRPMDLFSEEYLFYYGLKLMLLERLRQFDLERGEAAYQHIYDSIMNEDRSEVVQ